MIKLLLLLLQIHNLKMCIENGFIITLKGGNLYYKTKDVQFLQIKINTDISPDYFILP